MPDSRLTKGERTRSAITSAAHDLFITQGYHGTSMRQIAQNADLALGGIYNHFPGKSAIFEAVFIENHPVLEMLPALESVDGDTIEALVRSAADRMMQAIYKRPDFLNLMFIEIVEFKNAHIHDVFRMNFPRGLQVANKISNAAGTLRNIPLPMLIRAFISLFFSYYLADVIIGEIAPAEFKENAMDYYVDIFLHGILETDSTDPPN